MNANINYLVANTANGVAIADKAEVNEKFLYSFEDFRAALARLNDDEEIFCKASDEELAELDNEYGVRK